MEDDLLEGVVESPNGRVPKMNPDRTVSQEGRNILTCGSKNGAGAN